MTLILNQKDFEHVKDNSIYNHNFYLNRHLDYLLYEVCHEDENYYEYFIMEDGVQVFIGCSMGGLNSAETINIDFKKHYT